jgi:hypothetical protein
MTQSACLMCLQAAGAAAKRSKGAAVDPRAPHTAAAGAPRAAAGGTPAPRPAAPPPLPLVPTAPGRSPAARTPPPGRLPGGEAAAAGVAGGSGGGGGSGNRAGMRRLHKRWNKEETLHLIDLVQQVGGWAQQSVFFLLHRPGRRPRPKEGQGPSRVWHILAAAAKQGWPCTYIEAAEHVLNKMCWVVGSCPTQPATEHHMLLLHASPTPCPAGGWQLTKHGLQQHHVLLSAASTTPCPAGAAGGQGQLGGHPCSGWGCLGGAHTGVYEGCGSKGGLNL